VWEATLTRKILRWLGDHRVGGAVLLPGTAYLEMAIACGAEVFGDTAFHVTDVEFVEAMVFPDDDAAVRVQVVTTEEQPGRLRFQIASPVPGTGHPSWKVHARGTLQRVEAAETSPTVDLAALRARLGDSVPAERIYPKLTEVGFGYGPAFHGIVEAWSDETGDEALGRLRLPEAAGAAARYWMHPALLDACLHLGAAFGVRPDVDEDEAWVPVKVGSVRLLHRHSGELWSHSRRHHQSPDRSSSDIVVLDGTGKPIAEVSGVVAQRLASTARARERDDRFLEVDWELATVPAAKIDAGRWLLLGAGRGLGAMLCSALQAAGHAAAHAPGRDTSVSSVRALLSEAFGRQVPTAVVHLGSLDAGVELDADTIEGALVCGCDGVLHTVNALADAGFRDPPRLWLVTRGAQAAGAGDVHPAQAPMVGLGRVIATEHVELRCARLDLDPARPEAEVESLLAELLADDEEEEIALRGDERRVGRLVHRTPEAERPWKNEPRGERLTGLQVRADGSYLLTGGLGGLGLSVAAWLAELGAGHLVLVGRSGAASAEQQAAVAALEARGARVTVFAADVADRTQIEPLIREIAASARPLRGVIHAAGLGDPGMLATLTPARFRKVMAPKVLGAAHLHTLTRDAPLDFFVMYGSVAGLLGLGGTGHYAAANTFLDALAHHRRALGRPALSVDWGVFSEVGGSAAPDRRGGLAGLDSRGMRSLTPQEGLSALARLLESDRVQVGVVPLNLRQWTGFYPAAASSRMLSRLVAAQRAGGGRPAGDKDLLDRLAAAEPAARRAILLEALSAQVSQVLRIPEGKLDIDAPLTNLGMDSLMGLEVRNRVEAILGIAMPATLLWTYPTLAALSGRLLDLLSPAADPSSAAGAIATPALDTAHGEGAKDEASALEALRAMTDEEKGALLSEKLALLAQLIDE
jgi:myxalamid-type polyketide synthase MxaE and MxaD/epothilone polyketide synthase C/epothilone polyketide synthase D